MRLLHPGHDSRRGCSARPQADSQRRRNPFAHGRTPVPLLRLSEHRQSPSPRRGGSEEVNMEREPFQTEPFFDDDEQIIEPIEFSFGLKRRAFLQFLATGLVIATAPISSFSQER